MVSTPPRACTQSETARADVAGVERRRPVPAEPVERVAQLRVPQQITLLRRAAVGQVARRRLRSRGEDAGQQREQVGLHGVHPHALAGQPGGRGGQLGQRRPPEPLRRGGQPRGRAVGAARGGPDVEHLGGALEVHQDRNQRHRTGGCAPPGRLDEEVQQHRVLVGRGDEQVAARPQAGEQRFGHERGEDGGDGCVDRVAPCPQRPLLRRTPWRDVRRRPRRVRSRPAT